MSSNSLVYINGVLQHPSTYTGKGTIQLTGRNMPNSIKAFSQSPSHSLNSVNTVTLSPSYQGLSAQMMNPISISGSPYHSNVTSASFNFNDLSTNFNPLVKKYEIVETTEDIVALAVTAQRVFKTDHIHYKLLDADLFKKVTSDDRMKATSIKEYYSKKVMMHKLKSERKLSSFREDMNKLIHTDGTTFKESMIGVAYWLPEFYEYDLKLDLIKTNYDINQDFDKLNKQGNPGTLRLSVDLQPVECLQRRTKRTKNHEYWFKDTKRNAGVVIKIEDKNQLKHVWDYVFNNEKQVTISGQYTRQTLDNFEYFSITNWELQKG
jgi:hypothetical protein